MSTMVVPYISCIKLRGSPILPPVMDAVRRKEMLQYRDQALCIEKRLLYSKRVSTDSGLGTATSYEVTAGRDATISPLNNSAAAVDPISSNTTDCSSDSETDCNETSVQLKERNLPLSNAEFPLPQSNAEFPLPQSNAEFPLPQSNAEFPLPQSNAEFPLPQSSAECLLPQSDAKFPLPQSSAECLLPQSDAEFPCQSCTLISDKLVVESRAGDNERKGDSAMSEVSDITLTSNELTQDKKNDNMNILDETFSSVAMSASTDLTQYVDMSLTSSTNSLLACEQQESILPVSELLPLCVSNLKLKHKSLITGDNSDVATEESKKSSSTEHCCETTTSTVVTEPARPRLVRSNSYTLETPSPVLLAHVERAKRNCSSRDSLLPYQKSCAGSPDKEVARKFVFVASQPVQNVAAPQEVIVHNKLSTSLPGSTSTSPVKMKSPYASTECVPRKILPLKRKRSTNDSSNAHTTPDCDSFSSSQSFDSSNHLSHSDAMFDGQRNKDIRLLFLQLQSKYEKEKAELLARQQREQDEMEMMFKNQCERLVATIISQCPQVLAAVQSPVPDSPPVSTQRQVIKTSNSPRAPSASRQLFTYSAAENKAASIIQAAVRGYMVRRLMKTERVLNLKATILDTVKCALRLEQDCQKEVTPADVEFHRGLIIQLNAAILEFHHLFFSTNLTERMDMIATDRLRLRKQLTRSSSAQCAVSAATVKYQKRKSRDGSSEDSSRPNSSRSYERMCLSGKHSSRTNSVASAPVTYRRQKQENKGHEQHKRSNSAGQKQMPWR